jgi:16S rRNA processing protein RimM
LANSSNLQRNKPGGTPQQRQGHDPAAGGASGTIPPHDLVVMGRIIGAFGIKGWVKLQTFTEAPAMVLGYAVWWIGNDPAWTECRIEQAEVHADTVAVKLAGCEDRDAAALYRGKQVAIPREAFPAAGDNEFYWADLIGLNVMNTEGEDFGTVSEVFKTGANDVLVVEGERERLIPFTEQVVKQVDMAGRVIRVEWGSDY